jgi:hypothetical protein
MSEIPVPIQEINPIEKPLKILTEAEQVEFEELKRELPGLEENIRILQDALGFSSSWQEQPLDSMDKSFLLKLKIRREKMREYFNTNREHVRQQYDEILEDFHNKRKRYVELLGIDEKSKEAWDLKISRSNMADIRDELNFGDR